MKPKQGGHDKKDKHKSGGGGGESKPVSGVMLAIVGVGAVTLLLLNAAGMLGH